MPRSEKGQNSLLILETLYFRQQRLALIFIPVIVE